VSTAQLHSDDAQHWRLQGELDFATVNALERGARRHGAWPRSIDLSEVQRVDSAGLALLLGWYRRAHLGGANLRMLHVPEQLRSMAELYELDTLLLESADA